VYTDHLSKARKTAAINRKLKRQRFFKVLRKENAHLAKLLNDNDVAKLALLVLYAAEGTKNLARSTLVFGNSNPRIIRLFLKLLRVSYKISEDKFRCTVQCRADQDSSFLENFWSQVTEIPLRQFYRTRIDKRSIGKKTVNNRYKGVCRIDYLSAPVYWDLIQGIKVTI
jgi:hypothetical protein